MSSFLKSAKAVHDVESDLAYIEIYYDKYTKTKGYKSFTDYINAEPLGDWTQIQSEQRDIRYDKFLETMVTSTTEVQQRLAELALENVLIYDQDDRTYVRLAHTVKILDPTFQPPRVNMESAWQMEFIKKFCKKTLPGVIQECTNTSRLTHFFNILCVLQLA
jgi:hypothetical protein